MNYLKRKFQSSESGVTLILVLMLVAAVGLLVVPVMLIGASGLRATNFSEQRFNERYSADAGVEDALWRIKYEVGFDPDANYDYVKTFNELDTNIRIDPVPDPPNLERPILQVRESGGNMTGYKIVNRNLVEPCWQTNCDEEAFIYTLFIENYGTSQVNMFALGDCLPPGFVFKGVRLVSGFDDPPPPWGVLTLHDLLPQDPGDPLNSYLPSGEIYNLPVGEMDDENKKHGVFLSVIEDDDDLDHPCRRVDERERWQVKWTFSDPEPNVFDRDKGTGLGIVELDVVATDVERGIYFNEMWWDASPEKFDGELTGATSPVYARFQEWDITSSAGGTMVNARATILKNEEFLGSAPITIMSWQTDDGTRASLPPPPPGGPVPVAGFFGVPPSVEVLFNVSFTDTSTESPTSWSWNFGDGNISTAQNPIHNYESAGVYDVTLTATNEFGSDGEVKVNYITVTEPTVMHVNSIIVQGSGKWKGEAAVLVVDQNGVPVAGATVTGDFTPDAPNSLGVFEFTNIAGVATITSNSEKPTPPAIWCFTVTDVSLAGATYDAGAGVTSGCEGADATSPSLVSAEVDGTSLVITYDEPLDTGSTPAAADFTIGTDGAAQSVSTVAVAATTVTLTLTPGVTNGDTVDVTYTAGASPIQDPAGNDAAALGNDPVTNNTPAPDLTPPSLVSAEADGTSLVLTYNEPLDAGSVPGAADFTIGTDGAPQSVSAVAVGPTTVTLTLTPGVANGDNIDVSYTEGASPIQDLAGNDAAALGNEPVANTTPAPVPPLAITTPASLPDGIKGADYSFTLAATGGTTPYLWSEVGKWPQWLSLDPVTGVLSGKTNKTGPVTFDVEVTDSSGPVQSVIQTFSITILP